MVDVGVILTVLNKISLIFEVFSSTGSDDSGIRAGIHGRYMPFHLGGGVVKMIPEHTKSRFWIQKTKLYEFRTKFDSKK